MTLILKTDTKEAWLWLYKDGHELEAYSWLADRTLAATIHQQIHQLLQRHQADWPDLTGIVCFKGPGSFTGLRIGLSVANTLAYSLGISIVSETGENWQAKGLQRLQQGENEGAALPAYGSEAHISTPKR